MINYSVYESPIGDILLCSRNDKLIGAWFKGQKYYLAKVNDELIRKEDEILINAEKWLNHYFDGKKPPITELDLAPEGTEFRQQVWKILCEVPYGKTITYNDIAKRIAFERGIEKMSAQAIGGVVSHNPISIIIPCHRVIGSNGSLTGYAGGIDRKLFLLKLENPLFQQKVISSS